MTKFHHNIFDVLLYKGRLIFTLFFLFMAISFFAQITIQGNVIDQSDQSPLFGVNVYEEGFPSQGTTTDLEGSFEIEVSSLEGILIFSYVGYQEIRVPINGKNLINVAMSSGVGLNEVVVTALGIEREEKALGYSVQEVSAEKLTNVRAGNNMLNALTGKVAGLQTTSASNGLTSSSRLVIRGESSLNINDNSPLIVVDGIPINNSIYGVGGGSTNQSDMPTDYGNGAAEINPEDIETISVLKGAAAAALYGSRASNGVLLITTKSGQGQQGLGVSISSSTMFSSPLVLPEIQKQYGGGWGLVYYPDFGTNFGPELNTGNVAVQDGSPNFETGEELPFDQRFDFDDFFQTGISANNQISITGGYDAGSFRLSYANSYNEGIVPNTDLKRNNISFNSTYKVSDWWSVDLTANYINSNSDNVPVAGYGSQGVMYTLLWNYNNVDLDWLKNYWAEGGEDFSQRNIFSWADNPWLIVNENLNGFDKDRLFGKISTNFQITPELSLMLRSGTDYFDDLRTSRRPIGSQRYPNGMYREQNITFREVNTDFLLTYNKRFTNVSTVVSVGANRMNQDLTENFIEGRGLAIPGIYTLSNINVTPIMSRYNGSKRINSIYAFANLGYKDFLYLDLTARNDWSSTLPSENNSYFYPGASLSFIPSEIINMGNAVDYLKLRFNVARVGSDTDPFQLTRTYQFATLPNSVTNPALLPNSNLKPVQTDSYEFGVQGKFFKNRVGVDLTYYNTISRDQIISAGVSQTSGFSSTVINAGEIESEGIELALNATPVQMKNSFQWDLGINFTRNRSYVNELAEGIETFIVGYGPNGTTVEARPGGRMGDIYGEVFLRDPNGEIVFGENGLPLIDPERKSIGNYNPDFMVGLTTSLSFKGFFANVLFDIRRGGVIYSYTNAIGAESGLLTHSLPGRVEGLVGEGVMLDDQGNYVTNTTNVSPETWYYGGFYRRSNVEANSFDADFTKLRELSIGYRLPFEVARKLGLSSLSIAFVGHNVALWTDVPNIDPESHALNGGTLVPGFEVTQLPSTRSFGVKLNVGL